MHHFGTAVDGANGVVFVPPSRNTVKVTFTLLGAGRRIGPEQREMRPA